MPRMTSMDYVRKKLRKFDLCVNIKVYSVPGNLETKSVCLIQVTLSRIYNMGWFVFKGRNWRGGMNQR